MYLRLTILLVLFTVKLFSQSEKEVLKKLEKADSLFFTVNTSGCFDSGEKTYKFKRLKNGSRQVNFFSENKQQTRKISSKKFKLFLKNYWGAYNHFNNDKPPTCTLTMDFDLSDKANKLSFKNGTCENSYNPEMYLIELLK